MKRLAFVCIQDNMNLGDMVCSPRDYFPAFDRFKVFDLRRVPAEYLNENTLMIIGAGGMMHPTIDGWVVRRIKEQPTIIWGVGSNYHFGVTDPIPSLGEVENALTGTLSCMRDRGVKLVDWVPCVTCMHKAFDERHHPPSRDVMFYAHHNYPIPMPSRGYQATNELGELWDVNSVAEAFRDHQVIVTTSFHGMYWGMLLNRHVIVYRAHCTRMLSGCPLPESIHYVDTAGEAEWLAMKLAGFPLPQYSLDGVSLLQACRRRNVEFFRKALRRIDDFSGGGLDTLSN